MSKQTISEHGRLNLQLVEDPFVLSLNNGSGTAILIDAAPEIGGKGKGLRPMELLAGSLAACMAIDILNVLRKKRKLISDFRISVESIRSTGIPAVYKELILRIAGEGVSKAELLEIAELVLEKYCSVAASLHPGISIKLI